MSKLVNIYDIYVDVCRQHPWDATQYLHELGKSKHPHAHWARHMGKKLRDEKCVAAAGSRRCLGFFGRGCVQSYG
jgi:hypothetical protein